MIEPLTPARASHATATSRRANVRARPDTARPLTPLQRIQNTLVAAAVLVMLAVLIAHAVRGSTATLAVTPKPLAYNTPPLGAPSGRQELLNLAAAAARQPAAPATHPRYAYTKTSGWYLDFRVTSGSTSSVARFSTTESWLAPNGSGRVHQASESGGSRSVDDFHVAGRDSSRLLRLSPDESVLSRQLARGHPIADGPVEQFVALTDLAGRQPIPAHVESAILRLLSRAPGLIYRGRVNDRAGRPGVAVSLDSAYTGLLTRYTWIFDRHSGKLLADEETLLAHAGKLSLPKGTLLSYTTYLAAGWATKA